MPDRYTIASLRYPLQTTLPFGVSFGTKYMPHMAPQTWTQVNGNLAVAGTLQLVANPLVGFWGIRLYRCWFQFDLGAGAAATFDLRFSTAPTTIFRFRQSSHDYIERHVFDFSPFGLMPVDLTSNIELAHVAGVTVDVSALLMWTQEPIAGVG